MRMLWIVTIAVVLFATVSHANRANAAHPRTAALMAPLANGDAKLSPSCLSRCLSRLA